MITAVEIDELYYAELIKTVTTQLPINRAQK